MKNKILLILLTIISVFSLISCSFDEASGVIISSDLTELNIGERTILSLSTNEKAIWSSSDTEVARVDEFGIVTGISGGIATITAKVGDKEYQILVSVSVDEKKVQSMKITGKQTIYVGQGVMLNIQLENVTSNPTIEWSSSDEDIATISQEGVVTGVSAGIVTIKAKAVLDDIVEVEYTILVRTKSSILEDMIANRVDIYRFIIEGDFDLTKLNEVTTKVIDDNSPATLGVSNYQYVNVTYGQKTLERASVGSGVVFMREKIDKAYEYYLITNNHVIDKNNQLRVYLGDIDEEVDATLFATNADLDLAIVKFTSDLDITPVKLGSVENLKAGQFVIAIGNPEGYDYYGSATFGMISYVNRSLKGESALYIQHDAAINPGNSGGPLFNLDGELIGINTIKLADENIDNMGFSITIDIVKDFITKSGIKLN